MLQDIFEMYMQYMRQNVRRPTILYMSKEDRKRLHDTQVEQHRKRKEELTKKLGGFSVYATQHEDPPPADGIFNMQIVEREGEMACA